MVHYICGKYIWYVWFMVHMLPLRLVGLNLVLSPWVYWKTFKTIPMNKFYRISVCEQLQRFDMFPVVWYDNAFSASVTPIIFKVVAMQKLGSYIYLAKNNRPIVRSNKTENLKLLSWWNQMHAIICTPTCVIFFRCNADEVKLNIFI